MSSLGKFARSAFRQLPAGDRRTLRPLLHAVGLGNHQYQVEYLDEASMPSKVKQKAAAYQQAFQQIFGLMPSEAQLVVLRHMASGLGELTHHQTQRRVLAAFDQQDLRTGFAIRWDPSDIQVVKIEGARMHLDLADVSVSYPLSQGSYEYHTRSLFRRRVHAGMHVVDAGANIGLYTLLAARLVGPQGKVWSFEPNSENCRLLLASAFDNDLANIDLHPLALGNSRGYTFFTAGLGSNGGIVEQGKRSVAHPSCRIVPMCRLDDFDIPRLDFMKMDVEGAEGFLIEGAVETITRCRPVIIAEFSNEMLTRISGKTGAEFLRFFRQRNYAVFMLDKRTFKEVAIHDIDAFADEFVGTVRIEDLLLLPQEKIV